MAAGRSKHSECVVREHGSSRGARSGGNRAGVVPPDGSCVGAQSPRYCLLGHHSLVLMFIIIFFSHNPGVHEYLAWVFPTSRLFWGPQQWALWGVCMPQSKQDKGLVAGSSVILGNFRWICVARYSPCLAVVVPALHSCSPSTLPPCSLGMSPQFRWAGWSQPTTLLPGLHRVMLFSFLLTHSLTSSPLERVSRGFLITGSLPQGPAACGKRCGCFQFRGTPVSRAAPVSACFLPGILYATSSTTVIFFTSYPNNPRVCNWDRPLQRQTSQGERLLEDDR